MCLLDLFNVQAYPGFGIGQLEKLIVVSLALLWLLLSFYMVALGGRDRGIEKNSRLRTLG